MSLHSILSRASGRRAPNTADTLVRTGALYHHLLFLRTRSSAVNPRFYPGADAINKAAPSFPRSSTTRHTALLSTMSTRGKKRSAASASVPLQPVDRDDNVATAPDSVAPSAPRRSSRRTAPRKAILKDKGQTSVENMQLNMQLKHVQDGVPDFRRSLSEMEETFKRDIKRRKLQVEESVFESNPSQPASFRPRMASRTASSVLKPDRLLLTPDPCEADDQGWEPAVGLDDEAPETAEAADRGAKRAPAVNSDYLPLPWKGRLGYVSFSLVEFACRHSRLTISGMSEHVPTCRQTARLQLTNVSHLIHNRAPSPAGRSLTTGTCHQEPA